MVDILYAISLHFPVDGVDQRLQYAAIGFIAGWLIRAIAS